MSTTGHSPIKRHARLVNSRGTHTSGGFDPTAPTDPYYGQVIDGAQIGAWQVPPGAINTGTIDPGGLDGGVVLTPGSVDYTPFADTIRPVGIVGSLPPLPDTDYPVGSVVVLTTDGKLYRNVLDAWTAAVPTVDLTGTIVGAQIDAATLLLDHFADGARPIAIVGGDSSLLLETGDYLLLENGDFISLESAGALPLLPDPLYPPGMVVFNQLDNKLYRNELDVWVRTVDGADIIARSIVGGSLVALTITAAEIAAFTITAGQIAAGTITANEIAANTITANEILANTITAGQIAAGAIGATEIAARAITAAQIAVGTLTGTEIAANTITAAVIAAGTITGTEIAADAITAKHLSVGSATGMSITNADFETGDLTGWDRFNESGGDGYIQANLTGGLAVSGSYGVICRCNTSGTIPGVASQTKLAVRAGQYVTMSAYFQMLDANAKGRIYAIWYDESKVYLTSSSSGDLTTTGRHTYTSVAPAGAYFVSIRLANRATTGLPSYLGVDSIRLHAGDLSLVNTDGSVLIDAQGVAITNGALSVTNAGSTVIIDGTSNMFKIVTSGTLTNTKTGAGDSENYATLGGLGLPAGDSPAFIAFITEGTSPASNANRHPSYFLKVATGYNAPTSGGSPTNESKYIRWYADAYSTSVSVPRIVLANHNGESLTSNAFLRYHILKESAV